MGHKIRPDSLRLGIIGTWKSRWFARSSFRNNLEEDVLIRSIIEDKVAAAGIINIDIERTMNNSFRVAIKAARPGFVIGRGGKGIETLHKDIETALKKLFKKRGGKAPSFSVNLTIEELRRFEISAANIGQQIAADLEKRLPARRTMKKYLDFIMQNKEVLGARLHFSGRIDGAEIARRQWLAKGRLPLQTLRANIDYSENTAFTSYGTVGIKVMIYKGDIFEEVMAQ
jgi:small subunit ribosomal protein S3